ncbi:hypothetical protein QYF61_017076 [Mycteria americana]|uniref:Fork-head domain-containing protein n=1 Tax=Mycteria americana TaxID=33587 RepID=A0AAN7NAY5_MYCAM|nr:hypothetical protein QYF61_017076 [Mycteria americana]
MGDAVPGGRRPPGASFTIEYLLSERGEGGPRTPSPRGRTPPPAPRPPPEPGDKPSQSYIALISTAILSSPEKKLLLSDIYQWIMDNYPYFKNKFWCGFGVGKPGAEPRVLASGGGRGWARLTTSLLTPICRENACAGVRILGQFQAVPRGWFLQAGQVPFTLVPTDVPEEKSWRNSVRHNLSLNECFVKAGRSDNGKGHFWAIHPANLEDFAKGDYHRRRARRRVRR